MKTKDVTLATMAIPAGALGPDDSISVTWVPAADDSGATAEFALPLVGLLPVRVRLGGVEFTADDIEPLGFNRYRLKGTKLDRVDTSKIIKSVSFDVEPKGS